MNKFKPWLGTFEEHLYEGMKPIKSTWIANVGFRNRKRNCLRCEKPFTTQSNFICDRCTDTLRSQRNE